MGTIDRPVRFTGTEEQRKANHATHYFADDEDGRCVDCDRKPWYVSADYPCGAEVPRETVEF